MSQASETEHWNNVWKGQSLWLVDPDTYAPKDSPIKLDFCKSLGEVNGLRVLDLGCGQGELSVYLAKRGANVTALDTSLAAIQATQALAEYNGVGDKVRVCHGDLSALPHGEVFDLIAGIFVLHHLEPFERVCKELNDRLSSNGRGVFLENNSRNPLLMLSRRYLTGRFGIPKYGDASEYPFEPRELQLLADVFSSVRSTYPQLIFFRKLNTYIFRHKPLFRSLSKLNSLIDDMLYRVIPPVRKYSYNQVVTFQSRVS